MYSIRKRLFLLLVAFFLPVIISAVFYGIYSVAIPTEKMDADIVLLASKLSNPLTHTKLYFVGLWDTFTMHFAQVRSLTVIYTAEVLATLLWLCKPNDATLTFMALAFLFSPAFLILGIVSMMMLLT